MVINRNLELLIEHPFILYMRQTRFKKTNIIYILNITVPSKNDFSKINFTNNKNNILEKIYIDKICCIYIYIFFFNVINQDMMKLPSIAETTSSAVRSSQPFICPVSFRLQTHWGYYCTLVLGSRIHANAHTQAPSHNQ